MDLLKRYYDLVSCSRIGDLRGMVNAIDSLLDEGMVWEKETFDLAISSYLATHVKYPGQFPAFWHCLDDHLRGKMLGYHIAEQFISYQSKRKDFLSSITTLDEENQHLLLTMASYAGNLSDSDLITFQRAAEGRGSMSGKEWYLRFKGYAEQAGLVRAERHFDSLYDRCDRSFFSNILGR